MRALTWSLLERIFPRSASAALMLLLAVFVSPLIIGLYAWPMVVLTLFYSALDAAIRQIAVPSWKSKQGLAFLVRYRHLAGIFGVGAMVVAIVVMLMIYPVNLKPQILSTTPLILVPLVNAFGIVPLGYLQMKQAWSKLATMQLFAAGLSLLVSIPAVVLTHSLLGASLQVLLAEALFCAQLYRTASRLGMRDRRLLLDDGDTYRKEFFHSSLYSVVGWLQGQADRILIGAISGTSALGSYSFVVAIARNPGDAISASTANVLRPALGVGSDVDPNEIARRANRVLVRSLAMALVLVICIAVGVEVILRPLLGPRWSVPLEASIPAAISILPTVVSWSLTLVLMSIGRLAWGAPIKAVGIILAIPIALAAITSIEMAAWMLLLREAILLVLLLVASKSAAPWKAGLLSLALCGVLSVPTLLFF